MFNRHIALQIALYFLLWESLVAYLPPRFESRMYQVRMSKQNCMEFFIWYKAPYCSESSGKPLSVLMSNNHRQSSKAGSSYSVHYCMQHVWLLIIEGERVDRSEFELWWTLTTIVREEFKLRRTPTATVIEEFQLWLTLIMTVTEVCVCCLLFNWHKLHLLW